MDAKTNNHAMIELKLVNDAAEGIVTKLSELTRRNVIAVEDSIKIIKIINDSQCKWMEDNFNPYIIDKFVNSI